MSNQADICEDQASNPAYGSVRSELIYANRHQIKGVEDLLPSSQVEKTNGPEQRKRTVKAALKKKAGPSKTFDLSLDFV
jgi:hypothetical protein